MPTVASVAKRELVALNRLGDAMDRIAAATGISPIDIRRERRYPMVRTAKALEAFAEYAESIADTLTESGVAQTPSLREQRRSELEAMTRKQLEARAGELGINVEKIEGTGSNGSVIKPDLVEAIDSFYDAQLDPDAETEGGDRPLYADMPDDELWELARERQLEIVDRQPDASREQLIADHEAFDEADERARALAQNSASDDEEGPYSEMSDQQLWDDANRLRIDVSEQYPQGPSRKELVGLLRSYNKSNEG